MEILPVESLEILKESGVSFLFEDTEAWGELEYIIHAANPKKGSSLIKVFAKIINYSHGIYDASEIITPTILFGNEYQLRIYSESILNFDFFKPYSNSCNSTCPS